MYKKVRELKYVLCCFLDMGDEPTTRQRVETLNITGPLNAQLTQIQQQDKFGFQPGAQRLTLEYNNGATSSSTNQEASRFTSRSRQ